MGRTANLREGRRVSALKAIKHVLVATSSGAVLMVAASAAYAQAAGPAPATVAEVIVSASRITTAGFDAPTPTTVMGVEAIQKSAEPNIFTSVAQLPSLQGSTGTTVANGNTSPAPPACRP